LVQELDKYFEMEKGDPRRVKFVATKIKSCVAL
jgi:hypothetical protein